MADDRVFEETQPPSRKGTKRPRDKSPDTAEGDSSSATPKSPLLDEKSLREFIRRAVGEALSEPCNSEDELSNDDIDVCPNVDNAIGELLEAPEGADQAGPSGTSCIEDAILQELDEAFRNSDKVGNPVDAKLADVVKSDFQITLEQG